MTQHLLCLGHGYSARAVTALLKDDDVWTITGTARGEGGVAALRTLGFGAVQYDGRNAEPALQDALATATHLLVSAGPDEAGDPLLRHHRQDVLTAPHLKWMGYLSTVGVYGDQAGAWVDETVPVAPGSLRSKLRAAAEAGWIEVAKERACRLHIYRLSGIYGPGRSAVDKVLAGTARRIIKPGQVFNRIHVEDIAAAVMAGLAGRGTHAVYNVSDDEPAPPQDVIAYAAELLGRAVPPDVPFEASELGPMGRSFYNELKRIKNERLKSDLGVTLRYPTYREGLQALAAEAA